MERDYRKKTFSRSMQCDMRYMSETMRCLLEDPDRFLNDPAAKIIQDNFKSKLAVISLDGRRLVIKRHNYKSFWHQFKRYFRRTRAEKNWIMSHVLLKNNIWVPEPVAYVETRIWWLRGQSFFVNEFVDGINGEEYFKKNINSPHEIEQGIDLVVDLVCRIHASGYIHGDIRMSNLIFNKGRVCLLDLDDIKPITWYQVRHVRMRDIRGLKKDIFYNIPPTLQNKFLQRLESLPALL